MEKFTDEQVIAALESYQKFGEVNNKSGYFDKGGWAARCLQFHLNRLRLPPNQEVANVCTVCGASADIKAVDRNVWYCDNCIS